MSLRRRLFLIFASLSLWIGGWLWATRWHMVDDALIHLRYADNLLRLHVISYNGLTPSYGSSSLLYLAIVTLARATSTSVLVPKVISAAAYLLLLALLLVRIARGEGKKRALWFALLIVCCSPMAVRWLTDGLETSMMAALCVVVTRLAARTALNGDVSPFDWMMLYLGGFSWVLARTELAFAIAILTFAAGVCELQRGKRFVSALIRSSHLALGGLSALGVIYLTMGRLVPDTAVAKSMGFAPSQILAVPVVFAAAASFGLGMLAVWILSIVWALRGETGMSMLAVVSVNSILFVIVALIVLRGQLLHGVRYFVGFMLIMIVWNLTEMELSSEGSRTAFALRPLLAGVLVLAVLGSWAVESKLVYGIAVKDDMLKQMASDHLDSLHAYNGTAHEVGFIGYFTGANICDTAGLINGIEAARMSRTERIRACAASDPRFLFMNAEQLKDFAPSLSQHKWLICHTYRFTKAAQGFDYYLLVRGDIVPQACPTASQRY